MGGWPAATPHRACKDTERMHSPTRRLIGAVSLGGLLALGQGGLSSAASPAPVQQTPPADGTLSVAPALLGMAVKPGETGTTELVLRAGVPLNVQIAANGLGQGPGGDFEPVPADRDTSAFSARSMLTIAPESFRMRPGGQQKVKVTLSVPDDAGEGTRYAVLKITGTPRGGGKNVGIRAELGVTSIFTLDKTSQTHTGAIEDLTVDQRLAGGEALAVSAMLKNTGNSHFGAAPNQVITSATLRSANGDVVAADTSTMTGNSTVPTFSRRFTVSLTPSQPVSDGRYHLEVIAGLQDGTVLDRTALDFDALSGAVLGATSAPITVISPPAPPDDLPLILSAMLLWAAGAVALLALVRGRQSVRRRAGRHASGRLTRSDVDSNPAEH